MHCITYGASGHQRKEAQKHNERENASLENRGHGRIGFFEFSVLVRLRPRAKHQQETLDRRYLFLPLRTVRQLTDRTGILVPPGTILHVSNRQPPNRLRGFAP
jgi:hypothetical protein